MNTMLIATAAATAKPAGGAPIRDILIVALGSNVLMALTVAAIISYRRGGAPRLRRLEASAERLVGIPGWAALPGIAAIAAALVTIWGATWDIGLHIDVGRDEGPLGTAAHYPLLIGLLSMFLIGLLAIGMAPTGDRRKSPVSFRLPGLGAVPAAAVLLAAASAFAMIGFPLDDLWHRLFGQDVTLWGPTHTMFIGGVLVAGCGAVLLLVEGARTVGREPFGGGGLLRRPLAAVLAGIFLYLWTATLHEFNWGVPQYREVWQPMLLALGGAQTMVLARLIAGRGGCFGALAIWMPMQLAMIAVISGPLETTAPAMPLFVAEALIVELLAFRGEWRSPVRFGVAAGLAVGTIGFAANYAWTQVAMPLPWRSSLLAEGIPVAIAAAVAGGVLGALMAEALRGRLAGRRPAIIAAAAATVVLALGLNAAQVEAPPGATAQVELSNPRQGQAPGGGSTELADLEVRLSRPGLADGADWLYVLGWQGGGRYLGRLEPTQSGSFRTTAPVPIGGDWKSFVRVADGRTMLSAAVRMPADPAVGFVGYPAEPSAVRPMVSDTELMQVERKKNGAGWVWTPAAVLVLTLDLSLLVLLAVICVRLGRITALRPAGQPPRGLLIDRVSAVLDSGRLGRPGRRVPRPARLGRGAGEPADT